MHCISAYISFPLVYIFVAFLLLSHFVYLFQVLQYIGSVKLLYVLIRLPLELTEAKRESTAF